MHLLISPQLICRIEVIYFEHGRDCSKCGLVLRVIYSGITDSSRKQFTIFSGHFLCHLQRYPIKLLKIIFPPYGPQLLTMTIVLKSIENMHEYIKVDGIIWNMRI